MTTNGCTFYLGFQEIRFGKLHLCMLTLLKAKSSYEKVPANA